ncbi:hypothetical protein [Duganella vulcania]|uniref:Uncharacterized protein n=1 Tax=Duganella vulcania TaxID=2692166 RepID=A0A845GKF5_9BURK|nr:hypothetical protein [Duganella vulcania]MYM94461.1 hypothetical protein [Duganella vulcania]
MSAVTKSGTHITFDINDVKSTISLLDNTTIGVKRNKNSKKETRHTKINVTFRQPMYFSRACLTMDGRSIQIYGRPASILDLPDSLLSPSEVEVLTFYEGKEKRRVINAFYFENSSPPATVHRLLERYNHLYAIDTNTINFKDIGTISFTTVYKGFLKDLGGGAYGQSSGETVFQDYRLNVPGNPEVSAWRVLISRIQESDPKPLGRIGIIVDSELGKIKDINFRREPLIDDFYLPPNFELIFASDKSGKEEYFSNKLIASCESNSKRMLGEIERDNRLVRVTDKVAV